jgi:hypothetical protein
MVCSALYIVGGIIYEGVVNYLFRFRRFYSSEQFEKFYKFESSADVLEVQEGCHGRFLAGKMTTLAALSKTCLHCHH